MHALDERGVPIVPGSDATATAASAGRDKGGAVVNGGSSGASFSSSNSAGQSGPALPPADAPTASSVPPLLRRRSSSIDLNPDDELPSAMEVVGAIDDFGLGLVSWW